MELDNLRNELNKLQDLNKAKILQGFFKTGKGQYGEGDIFLGITVPESRKIAKKYKDIPLTDITELLKSKIHEERFIALLILVDNFQRGDENKQKEVYEFYLKSTKFVNNWDLVDLSAPKIVGEYLINKNREVLYKLARSKNLWEKRISIIATYQLIKIKEYKDTFKIAEILLTDKHDLIQKAVGWMLREVGKNISQEVEEEFLKKNYTKISRTTLRYAMERFDQSTRKFYMGGI